MEKSERFGLVLTPAEKAVAAQLADGESMAALIRRLIRQAAKSAGLWPPKAPSETIGVEGGTRGN